MGYRLFDQYSVLHLAVGIVAYFWNVAFWPAFGIHMAFEIFENTKAGMRIINDYFVGTSFLTWPGRKDNSDSLRNIIGDNIAFIAGYQLALFLDKMGKKNNWYHL